MASAIAGERDVGCGVKMQAQVKAEAARKPQTGQAEQNVKGSRHRWRPGVNLVGKAIRLLLKWWGTGICRRAQRSIASVRQFSRTASLRRCIHIHLSRSVERTVQSLLSEIPRFLPGSCRQLVISRPERTYNSALGVRVPQPP